MKKEEWIQLINRVHKERFPGVLGFDLLRGQLLYSQRVLNGDHLQVYGEDGFLRNMLQRMLECDGKEDVPIIFIASAEEKGLLEEVTRVLKDAEHERSECFLLYSETRPELSVRSVHFTNLFEWKKQRRLYVELTKESKLRDRLFLCQLEAELQKRFEPHNQFDFLPLNPFVYLFCPEKLEQAYAVTEYARRLSGIAAKLIFDHQGYDTTISTVYG